MNLISLYKEIENRTTKGSPNFYQPLDKEDSELIRADYEERVLIPLSGNNAQEFYSRSETLLAVGYERVVIGDYGAYVEFTRNQIIENAIRDKFLKNDPKPYQKYWWMESRDSSRVKIYEQIRTVRYADYKPGMFYISPKDLYIVGQKIYRE